MPGEEWRWQFTDGCRRDLEGLDEYARERIVSKPDEIVTDQWRDPGDYLEPLAGAAHRKLRVGAFRLGCRVDQSQRIVYVMRIRRRGGDAYRSDDD
ncbi:type II toxin-antitoxin system RelE/ParE family toxin [Halobaculum sp. MBLA0143]|uniref:type II toxin-antitoxin system RelE family toxin n=1 Tax=Halobaculum sp. MBLA0143 TaxID=3079933 RepID=UPI0035236325